MNLVRGGPDRRLGRHFVRIASRGGLTQRRLYSVDVAGLRAVDAWIGQFRTFWEPNDALATEIARRKRERRNAPLAKTGGKRA